MDAPAVVVRRGADRPRSGGDGVVSAHGLSFGAHYDPARTSFGALVAHNDDRLDPGAAYGPHDHADVEILAWVLDGAMVHRGPDGTEHAVGPGTLQHLAAGTGWHHDEAGGLPGCRLLQMWIAPGPDDPPAAAPALVHAPVPLEVGAPVRAAGGPGAPVALRRPGVDVWLARLGSGGTWALPDAAWRHVHVARGSLDVAGAGDDVEVTGPGPVTLCAGDGGAELVLVATS